MLKTTYAGYIAEHPADFICHIDDFHDYWIIINTLSEAEIKIDGTWNYMPPNQIIIFPPCTPGDYRAFNGPFVNHWVMFKTDEQYIINTTLPYATPIQVDVQDIISYLFHMIATENCFDNEYRSQSINHLFHLLFYKINECMSSEKSTLTGLLNRIRFEMQSNPAYDWSVPDMAKQLNISVGYMQSIYKKTFGISCMEDVFRQRIELAKNYIIQSSYSIAKIAEICGYKSTEHFCRQFKRITGKTASQYRTDNKPSA